MSELQKPDKKDLWCILGLFAGVVVFLLLFSSSTSPLTSWLGWDSTLFTLLGRSLVEGRTPYSDIFDIKGPLIYFIEALGQIMAPWRRGSFLIQIPFDLLTALFLYLTARLFLSRPKAMAAVGLSFVFLLVSFLGGNLTEEYCLTPAALCLYLAVRLFRGRWDSHIEMHPPAYALVYGLCSAFIIWIKVTHGALIFGLVLYFTCSLLWQKQFKCLLYNALAYVAGLAVVTVPLLLWFAARGALYDMLFGTFLAPLRYAQAIPTSRGLMGWVNIVKDLAPILAVMFLTVVLRLYRCQMGRMLLCCGVVSAVALTPGAGFSHYFIVAMPYVTVGAAMMFTCCPTGDKPVLPAVKRLVSALFILYAVVLSGAAVYFGLLPSIGYLSPGASREVTEETDAYARQGELIPPEERDSVLLYAGSTAARWYETNRIIPCYKYCVSTFIVTLPEVIEDYAALLDETPPLWLGVQDALLGTNPRFDPILQAALEEQYDLISSEHGISLYRLREP